MVGGKGSPLPGRALEELHPGNMAKPSLYAGSALRWDKGPA